MKTQYNSNTVLKSATFARRCAVIIGTGVILAAGNFSLVNHAVAQAKATVETEINSTVDESVWKKIDSRALDGLPETFIVRQTRFSTNGSGGMIGGKDRLMGKAMPLDKVVAFAYDTDASKLVLPEGGLTGKLDVLVNSGDGSKEKLREELKSQFGITARRETRHADVLQLTARQTNAPGLRPSANQSGSAQRGTTKVIVRSTSTSTASPTSTSSSTNGKEGARSGNISSQGQTIGALIKNIQGRFDKPIVDHTGLTGKYDVALDWSVSGSGSESDAVKQALADQAGLELIPANEAVEVLVVEKAKN